MYVWNGQHMVIVHSVEGTVRSVVSAVTLADIIQSASLFAPLQGHSLHQDIHRRQCHPEKHFMQLKASHGVHLKE